MNPLRRSNESKSFSEVPWLPDARGIDGTEQARIVVPDDTCRLVRTDDQLHIDSDEETPSRRR